MPRGSASVVLHSYKDFNGKEIEQRIITVVEPQDSARVKYRPAQTKKLKLPAAWQAFHSAAGTIL